MWQVWELDALFFRSRLKTDDGSSLLDYMSQACVAEFTDDTPQNFQVEDFYDSFEIGLTGFEVKFHINSFLLFFSLHALTFVTCNFILNRILQIYKLMPNVSKVSIIEKFNASVILWLCFFSDEPMLKQSEVIHILWFQLVFV